MVSCEVSTEMWGIEPVCWCPVVVGYNVWVCRETLNRVGRPSQHKAFAEQETTMCMGVQQARRRQGKQKRAIKGGSRSPMTTSLPDKGVEGERLSES